jgi:hypothetical protein
MWQHEAGRIDFDEPLLQLLQRGWRFRECAPSVGAQDGGWWAVIGVHGWTRVRADRSERREAWAEAVRLALMAAIERGTLSAAPLSGTMGGPPDDPTVCDEERARLRAVGWTFSEHLTAQARGREAWVVSGTQGGRRIRAVDDDRSDAWGTVLILATVTETAASGGPPEPPPPPPRRMRHGGAQARTVRRRLYDRFRFAGRAGHRSMPETAP